MCTACSGRTRPRRRRSRSTRRELPLEIEAHGPSALVPRTSHLAEDARPHREPRGRHRAHHRPPRRSKSCSSTPPSATCSTTAKPSSSAAPTPTRPPPPTIAPARNRQRLRQAPQRTSRPSASSSVASASSRARQSTARRPPSSRRPTTLRPVPASRSSSFRMPRSGAARRPRARTTRSTSCVVSSTRDEEIDANDTTLRALKTSLKGVRLGEFIIVMPAADRNLQDIFQKERPDVDRTREMVREMIQCLAHVHEKGLSHGDIKMNNVVRVDEKLLLIDLDAVAKLGGEQSFIGAKFVSGLAARDAVPAAGRRAAHVRRLLARGEGGQYRAVAQDRTEARREGRPLRREDVSCPRRRRRARPLALAAVRSRAGYSEPSTCGRSARCSSRCS